jgi:iron complex transport system substrate-binding protein
MRGAALLLSLAIPAFAQAAPHRIVSLNPCLDAILVEVADRQQIRAISHYSHDPRAASISPSVARHFRKTYGTAEDILIENADLVLADMYTPAATRRSLSKLGIKLLMFDVPKSAADSIIQIRTLATAVGQNQRGEALIARITTALAVSPKPAIKPAISALIRSDSGFVLGRGTVMDDLLQRSGFSNASTGSGMKMSDIMPIESLLLKPPELLFVISDNTNPHARHPVMQRLMQHVPTYSLPPSLVNCAGPTMIRTMAFLTATRKAQP